MNRFHKTVGFSLAALMLASSGITTFAKDFDDVKNDHVAKTEISILSDIGVIKGTGATHFSPDDLVSREQMATLLFRLMLGRDDAGRNNTTAFTDLYEPYYNGAISWASSAGYILGTSKNTFNPTGGITKQDAMAMLIRALGQSTDKMNEGYPWSYINAGVKLGLDRGLENVAYDETLTRAETAMILFNALTSEYLIGKTTVNGNIYYESTSIIEEVFGYSMAEATIVSTNDYTLEDNTVVKNGYVTLLCKMDGKSFHMTVPFSEMNLDGEANAHLGMNFRVIYSTENDKHSVLSAVPMSKSEHFDEVKIDKDRNTVKIGENKYTLVDEYSDELSTNNNELILYAYDADGELELIEDIDELKELLGFYRVTLIFDDNSDIAKRAILRVFEMDQLKIDDNGKINIAGNKKSDALNITNNAKAKEGDYVLYYYNEKTAELEIAEILDIASGTVRRITGSTVKIGEEQYNLGNETAGITAESLRNKLVLGANANVVIYKDTVVAIVEGVTITDDSKYLVALDDAYRIYENGSFRYVLTAFIDGEQKNIYVKNSDAKEGNVYRYTETAGVYNLLAPNVEDGIILSGKSEFVQNQGGLDEIAYIIESAKTTTIEIGGKNYYTLNAGSAEAVTSVGGLENVRFVCDKDTVIVVNDDGKLMQRSGTYHSTINVNDGAQVIAVFDNEVGSVETLKYLYISDGSLGNYDLDAEFVRVLAANGLVYENGRQYVEYIVYNFATGKIDTMLSSHGELVIGADYRCGNDDTITDERTDIMMNGFVSGYTSGTVSIDGAAYTFGEGFRAIRITSDNKVEEVKLSDLYMMNVEFIADKGEIKLIIEASEAVFTTEATDRIINITPDFDLTNFAESKLELISIKQGETAVDVNGAKIAKDGNTIVVELAEGKQLANGEYELSFKLGNKSYEVNFTVAVEAEPELPETPETPEVPDNSEAETPETPDNGEAETPEMPDNSEGDNE